MAFKNILPQSLRQLPRQLLRQPLHRHLHRHQPRPFTSPRSHLLLQVPQWSRVLRQRHPLLMERGSTHHSLPVSPAVHSLLAMVQFRLTIWVWVAGSVFNVLATLGATATMISPLFPRDPAQTVAAARVEASAPTTALLVILKLLGLSCRDLMVNLLVVCTATTASSRWQAVQLQRPFA